MFDTHSIARRAHLNEDPTIPTTQGQPPRLSQLELADLKVCIAACASLGEAPKDKTNVLAVMKQYKGTIGAVLAREFVAAYPFAAATGWPEPLLRLTSVLREYLASGPGDGEVPE